MEVVDDWPAPACGPADVVVRMRGVGLCGSDLAVYAGKRPAPFLPWVMGHEGGGEIVAVGARVADRQVGQRVVVEPNYCCFACPPCRAGRTSACQDRRIVGINHAGLLAELAAVPARFTWPVPATLSDQALVCLEPLTIARTAVRRSGVRPADSCLVIGTGSQGLFVCMALVGIGARPDVIEPDQRRLDLAKQLGARPAPADGDGGGGGESGGDYQFVFEASGAPAAWEPALRHVAATGTVLLIGQSPEPVRLATMTLVQRQLTVRGTLIYDHPGDFADTLAAVATDGSHPEQVVRASFPFEEAPLAFAEARNVPGKSWIQTSPAA